MSDQGHNTFSNLQPFMPRSTGSSPHKPPNGDSRSFDREMTVMFGRMETERALNEAVFIDNMPAQLRLAH